MPKQKAEKTDPDFEFSLEVFLKDARTLCVPEYYVSLKETRGGRYIKITSSTGGAHGGSVWAFIDTHPDHYGDILKPASFRAPAKHARGNIFSPAAFAHSCNWTGPRYLR